MSPDVQTIVIGAGVVGLSVARALALRGHEVMVLEQHALIGSEISSRNSEVIHAGLYYPTGSLRARLCVAGKHQLYAFASEHGVAHKRLGKLLVATADEQIKKLKSIEATARANGVTDLVWLTSREARALEPRLACVAAILSPSTGIVDSHGFMLAVQGHAETNGAQVVLNTPVTRLERGLGHFKLETGGDAPGAVTCRNLVIAAGLHASKLTATLDWTGRYRPPATYYAKGQYYALAGRSPFQRHIYPVPDGAWLGLHVTVDIGGRCKFGPDIEWIPEIDYAFDAAKLDKFLDFIRSYYPGLDAAALHPDYTGIRPKLYKEGEPVPDFAIHGAREHGVEGLVALYGIESPGLTASLAIGDLVADLI